MLADPVGCQSRLMHEFVEEAKHTAFGKDHDFDNIRSYEDFKARVPLRNYEQLLPYIERIKAGEKDILWKGRPAYFGKTSGTTSKTKYIPVTEDSLRNHIGAGQYSALHYACKNNKLAFLKGKSLFFSDGHFFEDINGIKTAPISTIGNSRVPWWYKWLHLPSDEINAIPDYKERIGDMIDLAEKNDIRIIVRLEIRDDLPWNGLVDETKPFPGLMTWFIGGVGWSTIRLD
jgi:hypothetical protein